MLRQNNLGQATVIRTLIERQQSHAALGAARAVRSWCGLVRRVARTIRTMPLWKLQRVGNDVDEFRYRKAEFAADTIRLLTGVPQAFRTLHSLVLDCGPRRVDSANRTDRCEPAAARRCQFGSERGSLAEFAPVLRDRQRSRCLYCSREVRGAGDVDHFIAWSRYPVDLGHNLVLAHTGCNAKKRDFLAYPRHLERWFRTNIERAPELSQRLDALKLPHDAERTRGSRTIASRGSGASGGRCSTTGGWSRWRNRGRRCTWTARCASNFGPEPRGSGVVEAIGFQPKARR